MNKRQILIIARTLENKGELKLASEVRALTFQEFKNKVKEKTGKAFQFLKKNSGKIIISLALLTSVLLNIKQALDKKKKLEELKKEHELNVELNATKDVLDKENYELHTKINKSSAALDGMLRSSLNDMSYIFKDFNLYFEKYEINIKMLLSNISDLSKKYNFKLNSNPIDLNISNSPFSTFYNDDINKLYKDFNSIESSLYYKNDILNEHEKLLQKCIKIMY